MMGDNQKKDGFVVRMTLMICTQTEMVERSLWCDGRKNFATSVQIGSRKRKQKVTTKQQEKEEEVDHIFSQLKDKQGDKYDHPKLRLWARMIASGLHESTDDLL